MDKELQLKVNRWQAALKDAACGPLVIAGEVVQIAAEWDAKHKKTEGGSCTAFLKKTLNNDLQFFVRRARAAKGLGALSRTLPPPAHWVHHSVAVWISEAGVDASRQLAALTKLRDAWTRDGRNPASYDRARRLVGNMVGIKRQPKGSGGCPNCAGLRAENERLRSALAVSGKPPPQGGSAPPAPAHEPSFVLQHHSGSSGAASNTWEAPSRKAAAAE